MTGINKKGRPGNKMEDFLDNTRINVSTGCWEWQGYKDRDGYGQMGFENKNRLVHRLAYMLYNQCTEEDIKGKVIMHLCDNPSCVNPEHLQIGTQKDNIQDCIQKGRRANRKGEQNPNAKLTEYQAQKIRELYQLGISQEELAKMFNVARRTIYNVRKNISWSHVSFE